MTIKNKTLGSVSLLLLLVLLNINSYAATESVSREEFKNIGGSRYWESAVKCSTRSGLRYIRKQTDSDQWCLKLSPETCFSKKLKAAQKTCTRSYSDIISASAQASNTEQTPEPIPEPIPEIKPVIKPVINSDDYTDDDDDDDEQTIDYDALRKEKLELEASRLTIQQEILELKRQEIELQKSTIVN